MNVLDGTIVGVTAAGATAFTLDAVNFARLVFASRLRMPSLSIFSRLVYALPASFAVSSGYGFAHVVAILAIGENVPNAVARVISISLTTVLCLAAIIAGVICAKRGRSATALFVVVCAVLGLTPVSICTAGVLK